MLSLYSDRPLWHSIFQILLIVTLIEPDIATSLLTGQRSMLISPDIQARDGSSASKTSAVMLRSL